MDSKTNINFDGTIKDLTAAGEDVEHEEINTTFSDRDINALRSQAEIEAMAIENKLRAEELKQREQDREQRKSYALYAFWFLVGYMALVFIILLLSGFRSSGFNLKDGVLIALITTTTANVIGIFAFVMKYLFNTGNNLKNKDK